MTFEHLYKNLQFEKKLANDVFREKLLVENACITEQYFVPGTWSNLILFFTIVIQPRRC